ncbi:hypothetical protein Nepgr_008674 [Nepenthes gracilis]|uniref:Uncharacterized protein n=1 Tax=Nepenthes gracilis TaxID=150966 RepID=A0AAD3S9T2_NEPGR|nr:hypothetical protein Nepgr_008674 [Nepenthes gracilis]
MGLCASIDRNSDSRAELRVSFVPSKTDKHSIPSTPIKQKPEFIVDHPPINSMDFKSQSSPLNSARSYRSHGSKEETFFDPQPWLESDCDDDFYSVNGDFTPSRGSTPIHGSAEGTPQPFGALSVQANRAVFEGRPPLSSESKQHRGSTPLHLSASANSEAQVNTIAVEGKAFGSNTDSSLSSPADKKKKLLDLFRQSRDDEGLTISGLESVSEANVNPEMKPDVPESLNGTPYLSGTNSVTSGGRTPVGDSNKPGKEKPAQCCFPRLVSSRSFHKWKKPMSPSIAVDA